MMETTLHVLLLDAGYLPTRINQALDVLYGRRTLEPDLPKCRWHLCGECAQPGDRYCDVHRAAIAQAQQHYCEFERPTRTVGTQPDPHGDMLTAITEMAHNYDPED